MNRHKFVKAFFAAALTLCLCFSACFTGVSAASATYTLADLAAAGSVKMLGRTKQDGTGLVCDWSGTGFEMNITAPSGGTQFTVNVDTDIALFVDIIVDGDKANATREKVTGAAAVTKAIPAGAHTVRVIRDSQSSAKNTKFFKFESVTFEGSIGERPTDKNRYIEIIGDSYACGDGAMANYKAGVKWTEPEDDSIMYSFGYKAAELLDADYSIVARGGIGLLGAESQQDTDSKTSMTALYPYIAGEFDYKSSAAEYGFERKPDLIVVELGANDGQSNMTEWGTRAKNFVDLLKAKNGDDVPILWIGTGASYKHDLYLKSLAATVGYENLGTMRYHRGGNGSAALASQFAGHPSASQQEEMGRAIAQRIENEYFTVYGAQETKTPEYTFTYYADGVSGGDGSETSPFTYISEAEKKLAADVSAVSGTDSEISARIIIKSNGTDVRAAAASTLNSSITGSTAAVKSANGNPVTVEIIGQSTDGATPTMLVSSFASKWRRLYNFYRFENINITGAGETNGAFNEIYCYGNSVTFDKGTTVRNSTATAKNSNDYLYRITGGTATNAANIKDLQTAKTKETASNIVINSGNFNIVAAGGIGAFGAYSATDSTDPADWVYDCYTENKYFRATVNGGTVQTLRAGENSMVTGKMANIIITVNGGSVENLNAGCNFQNTYGKRQEGNFTVNINGGTVRNYLGLAGGVTYGGEYVFNMKNGKIGGEGVERFCAVGASATVKSITNNISGGSITVYPTAMTSGSCGGVFFGGYNAVTTEKAVNNISGGEIVVRCKKGVQGSVFMGGENNCTIGTLQNNVSGGAFLFYPADESVTTGYSSASGIYMASYIGRIKTELQNNITGGLFDVTPIGTGMISFSGQGLNTYIKKLVNTIGVEGTDIGPVFRGNNVHMGGTWGKNGVDGTITAQPDKTSLASMSDTVVIKNTVNYLESYGVVRMAPASTRTTSYVAATVGSVENTINGGLFKKDLYCGGGEIYGSVKTTVNGGFFCNIYGYGTDSAASGTYNGTELIINAYNSYAAASKAAGSTDYQSWGIYAGSKTAAVAKPVDTSKPALELTVTGGNINIPVYGGTKSGTVNGNIENSIGGGNFTASFFGGSESGTVNGDIKNEITGGTFAAAIYGGARSATVNGHVSNTLSLADNGNAFYGGSSTGEITNGVETLIKKYKIAASYTDKGITAGSATGKISAGTAQYAVKLTVSPAVSSDKYREGDVAIDGSVFLGSSGGEINGDVYALITGGNNVRSGNTARHLVLGNGKTIAAINGNVTCDMQGGFYGGTVYLGNRTASGANTNGVSGDVTFNLTGGHIGSVSKPFSAGGATVNINPSDRGVIINGTVGGKTAGYTVNYKAGGKSITSTGTASGTAIYFDRVDLSENKAIFTHYRNWSAGRIYYTMPTGTPKDRITVTNSQSEPTGGWALCDNGSNLLLVGTSGSLDSYSATFTLDEALTANILVNAGGAVSELISAAGRCNYSYTFMGKTINGYFDKNTATRTVDDVSYYEISFGVPTGRFAETVTFICDAGVTKNISIDSILAAGEKQYGDDENVSALFKSVRNYGAEAAAVFYGGEAPAVDYTDTDALIGKYSSSPTVEKKTYLKGMNLLLKDKVSVQLYIKTDDISKLDSVIFNGKTLGLGEYTVSAVTNAALLNEYNYVVSVPVAVKSMASPVSIVLTESGEKTDAVTVSIGYFCKTYIKNGSALAQKYAGVSKALLEYIDKVAVCYGS